MPKIELKVPSISWRPALPWLRRGPQQTATRPTAGGSGSNLPGPASQRGSQWDPETVAALGFYFLFFVMSLLQQPGRTTVDTRIELTERPGSFLAGALSLWHQETNLGEIQNQAYGYLFPQGAYFWLMDLLHLPAWITQRIWTTLLLVLACEGARRVARAVGVRPGLGLVAGLVFALSPRILGTVGVLTAETLPGVVMPFVALPLIHAMAGRLRHRPAIVMSAGAVVAMGGVNAVENIASLPLPGLLLLWAAWRSLVSWRLVAEWLGLVFLAGAWWILPLLVLGKYSPPFYQYVESAEHTTGVIGWGDAVRGATHWVSHVFVGAQPWWPAASEIALTPHLILITGLISAIGLYGLVRFPNDLRTPLVASLVFGLALLTVAHGGWEGAPVSGWFQTAFDGMLQIFRNVHKLDPIVRLPLALGFATAVGIWIDFVADRWPRSLSWQPALLLLPITLALAVGQPFLAGHGRIPGFKEISSPWQQANDYLAANADGRASLIVPGVGFNMQRWGWTLDEPLLAMGEVPYIVRSQVPLVPGQSIRSISALNELVSSGKATQSLTQQLARAGIGHVVIRRDLDRSITNSPHPGGAEASMRAAGLELVADYGVVSDGGPEIQIFKVATRVDRVVTTSASDTLTVAGSPETYLTLQDAGLLAREQATVLEGEDGWSRAPDIVTDETARRERAFGNIGDSQSAVLQEGQPWRQKRAAHDFPGAPKARETFARYPGLAALTASSSQGYADTFGRVVPSYSPYSAVDGNPQTRWVSSPLTVPDEQWIELTFPQPRELHTVRLLPVVNDTALSTVRTFVVEAGGQKRRVDVNPTGAWVEAEFDGRKVDSVRVSVARASMLGAKGQVGLRDVLIDNLVVRRTMVVPNQVPADGAFVFTTAPDSRACVITNGTPACDVNDILDSEESGGINRTFTTAEPARIQLSGRAAPRSGPESARLLDPGDPQQAAGASSFLGQDPRVSARFAYDGNPDTAWISAREDSSPTLTFSWDRPRTISQVRVTSNGDPELQPKGLLVVAGDSAQKVSMSGSSMVRMEPVTTDRLELRFDKLDPGGSVLVSEVTMEGYKVTRPWWDGAGAGAFCGLGPNVFLDGQRIPTRVNATVGDIVDDRPVRWTACDKRDGQPATTEIQAGTHELRTESSAEFQIVQATGKPVNWDVDRSAAGDERVAHDFDLGNAGGTVQVSDGAETVMAIDSNFNVGWKASLGDTELEPLRVDGWRQGWIVPAGVAGTVDISFGPQTPYRVIMILGLLVSGSVLVAGAWQWRRNRGWNPASAVVWPRHFDATWPVLLGLAAAVLLLMGPVALVGAIGGWALRRHGQLQAASAAALVALSGLIEAYEPIARVDRLPDALAALAIGLMCGVVLGPPVIATGSVFVRRLGPWAGLQGACAAIAVTALTIWRNVLVRGSYFNQDDYYLVTKAFREETLSWKLLTSDINGHLTPLQQVAYWLVAHGAPFNFEIVAAGIILTQWLAMMVMWHVLSRLLPGRWIRLVLLVAFGCSTMTLPPTLWWSAAMGLWPPSLCALVAILFAIRLVQGVGRAWVSQVMIVLSLLMGLLWHERSVLTLPVVFGLVWALRRLDAPATLLQGLLETVTRYRWLWSVMTLLVTVFIVAHRLMSKVEGASHDPLDYLKVSARFLFDGVAPGLVSGPWTGELLGGVVYPNRVATVGAWILVAALGGMLLRRGGPMRWRAAGVFAGYLVADVTLILLGRSAWGDIIGLDTRYFADVLPVAVVFAAVALVEAPPYFGFTRWAAAWPRVRTIGVAGAVVAYVSAAAVSTTLLVPHFQNPQDRAFVAAFRDGLRVDPDVVVYDSLAPQSLIWGIAQGDRRLSDMFEPLPEAPWFTSPGARLERVSDDGAMLPMTLKRLFTPKSMVGDCPWPVTAERETLKFEKPVTPPLSDQGDDLVMNLNYFTNEQVDFDVVVGKRTYRVHAQPGPQQAWLVIPRAAAGFTTMEVVLPPQPIGSGELKEPSGAVCVTNVLVGGPDWDD